MGNKTKKILHFDIKVSSRPVVGSNSLVGQEGKCLRKPNHTTVKMKGKGEIATIYNSKTVKLKLKYKSVDTAL